jgi:hypothetical protein
VSTIDGSTLPTMSVDLSGEITAIATAALALFAVVTAVFAILAFRKQSQEVGAIERQVKDQEELTAQQARLLEVQSGQFELQRQQLEDQRRANAEQAEVLRLQADELRESLAVRKRASEEQRKAQASRVYIRQSLEHMPPGMSVGHGKDAIHSDIVAHAVNTSDQPVYDAELYWRRDSASYGKPNPQPLGTILPGEDTDGHRPFPDDTNMEVSGAILRFRDAAGVKWIRRPDGGLMEQQ